MPFIDGLPAGIGHTLNSEQDSTLVTESVKGVIDATFMSQTTGLNSEATFLKLDKDRNVYESATNDKYISIPAGAKLNFAVLYPLDSETHTTLQSLAETGEAQVSIGLAPSPSTEMTADGHSAYSVYGAYKGSANAIQRNPSLIVRAWHLANIKSAPIWAPLHSMSPVPRTSETVFGMYPKLRMIQGHTRRTPLRLGIHIEYSILRDDVYSRFYSTV